MFILLILGYQRWWYRGKGLNMSASGILFEVIVSSEVYHRRGPWHKIFSWHVWWIYTCWVFIWVTKSFWFLLRGCRAQGHGLICFISACLQMKFYLSFYLGFFVGIGFFCYDGRSTSGKCKFSLYSLFLICPALSRVWIKLLHTVVFFTGSLFIHCLW